MTSEPRPFTDGWDEAREADGAPRPHYAELLAALAELDLEALHGRVQARLAGRSVSFGEGRPFVVDPVPRLIPWTQWWDLAEGLAQRMRALERFVRDVYGERRIVAAGLIPAVTINEAEGLEPGLWGCFPAHGPAVGVAGLDLVRDPDGEFLVLEDNLRVPSGYAYAIAAREAVSGEPLPGLPHEDFAAAAFAGLANTLLAAAPPGVGEPNIVVLTDGLANTAHHEHARAARRLDVPLVLPRDLEVRDGRLFRRGENARLEPVDVLYRRSDQDRLADPLAELLLEPWLGGRLGLVNPYGTGVADDKAVHAHVEDMVRFYLGQEPLLRSVPTLDLAEPAALEEALARIDELVVKPRFGHGGHGIVVCAHASRADVERIAGELRRAPTAFVVQPTIALSTHPTVVDGALAPRHVDLRPFAFSAVNRIAVPPGGLTRVAFGEGALVVNSSQRGGGKDTRVVDDPSPLG
jgi:uncharacterized circularly permuted ATP-grasp superfamily protein